MYSFGKEVRDLKEAEHIFIEKIENDEFDSFLEKTDLDKDFLISNIHCEESFVLGINNDFELEDLFNINTQQGIIEEIKTREAYRENSLIIGDGNIYIPDTDETIVCYFISSHAFSHSNNNKILLLSLGLMLHDKDGVPTNKQFVIV